MSFFLYLKVVISHLGVHSFDVSSFVGTRIDRMTEFFSLFFNLMFMGVLPKCMSV